jgi:hypothetical protein
MSKAVITERLQYWLDHIRVAEAFDGPLVENAKAEGMKVKDLYQWKTILIRRGFVAKPIPPAFGYYLVVSKLVTRSKPSVTSTSVKQQRDHDVH